MKWRHKQGLVLLFVLWAD